MAYNHEYPYVDPNRYNSDWILHEIKSLRQEMSDFEALNEITFSGEWDITKQYPAWTIVNDNNGRDGYISIQPVPAGVTIDNADYWRAVANYSDLIADLQNRMIALEGEVTSIQNREGVTNDFAGKNVLIIGDSIGDEGIANLQPNYVVHLRQALQTLGATVTNNSLGGRCIASGYTAAGGIQEAIAGITGTYDIVIVELGINDWAMQATRDDVTAGLTAFQAWIVTNMPAARVFWVTPLSTIIDGTKIPLAYYRDIILYWASHCSYSIIDAYAESDSYNGTNSSLVSMYTRDGDGVHPNPTYAPIYARFIMKRLLSGGSQINYNGVASFNGTNVAIGSTPVVCFYRPGGRIQLMGGYNASFTPGSAVLNCGQLPAWCRPFETVTYHHFSGYDVAIRSDGTVYLVFNNGVTSYTDVFIHVEYDCRNNQFVSIS